MNTASPKLCDWLYGSPDRGGWGFRTRYIKLGNKNTTQPARDVDALLSIYREHPKDKRVELCLRLSDLLTQQKMLGYTLDKDGRLRFSVKLLGSDTGRMAVHRTANGNGYNLHSTPDRHKHLLVADPGHELCNLDLSGADGWTVGCESAALGDPMMLDDLRAGLKPAQALALLYLHGAEVNRKSRPELIALAKLLNKQDWLYPACKTGCWAFCYGSGPQSAAEKLTEDSYKDTGTAIYVETAVMRRLQGLLFTRYPGIQRRMTRINMLLATTGKIASYNGHERVFFGRRNDAATQRKAYAESPQVTTTWATKLAWKRCFDDPSNRRHDGTLIVRPLLLVHDAIVSQHPIDRRDAAIASWRTWLDNELVLAGTKLRIPASGACGPTWAHAAQVPGHEPTAVFDL